MSLTLFYGTQKRLLKELKKLADPESKNSNKIIEIFR